MNHRIANSIFRLLAAATAATAVVTAAEYGVDCSFPIHRVEDRCDGILGDRLAFYEEFMQGCRDHYGPKKARACDSTEADRLEMSLYQPQSMVVS